MLGRVNVKVASNKCWIIEFSWHFTSFPWFKDLIWIIIGNCWNNNKLMSSFFWLITPARFLAQRPLEFAGWCTAELSMIGHGRHFHHGRWRMQYLDGWHDRTEHHPFKLPIKFFSEEVRLTEDEAVGLAWEATRVEINFRGIRRTHGQGWIEPQGQKHLPAMNGRITGENMVDL